jgi:hypothetical protein
MKELLIDHPGLITASALESQSNIGFKIRLL